MTAVVINFPKPLKPRDEAFNAACEAFEYFDESIKTMESTFITDSRGVIAGMHNMFGGHRPEIKKAFLSFCNRPSAKTWQAIRSYLLDLSTTSWQLWIKYDPKAPRLLDTKEKENLFPAPDDFLRYYAQHKQDRLIEVRQRRDAAQAIINTYE